MAHKTSVVESYDVQLLNYENTNMSKNKSIPWQTIA